MANRNKPPLFKRGGLLSNTTRSVRIMTLVTISVAIASLIFMQLGFIKMNADDVGQAYIVILLPLIALGSLLLGIAHGTFLGFLAGTVLYMHSIVQPLDYYELIFITPLSPIIFGITGFVLGAAFAFALRNNPTPLRGGVYIALICTTVSNLFSLTFSIFTIAHVILQVVTEFSGVPESSVNVEALSTRIVQSVSQMGDPVLQAIINSFAATITCLVAAHVVRRINAEGSNVGLRSIFRRWLMAAVLVTFLASSGVGFALISEQTKWWGNEHMSDELEYLCGQLERTNADDIQHLLDGYSYEYDGTIVIFKDDKVLLTDNDAYLVGESIETYLGENATETARTLASSETMLQIVFNEHFVNLNEEYTNDDIAELAEASVVSELAYQRITMVDNYTLLMIIPASKVYETRWAAATWVTLSTFVLLLVVFVVASRLLALIVVRRIDETNHVLERITQGDLEARVDITNSREFTSLSTGVNTTVDALKGWIAEAERRIDTELTTAKAIQESALPREFPPFPDIPHFDIFATMHAAKEVGGDFYDFFLIGDESSANTGKVGFVMADVSGKGIPAALFMMSAKTIVRDNLRLGMEPNAAITNTNDQLCANNDAGMFVTLCAGVLDYATGKTVMVNAGHNPPLLRNNGNWNWLTERSGLPLGMFDGVSYKSYEIQLQKDDLLLLYTDGVTEAMDVEEQLYGDSRLESFANTHTGLDPKALIEGVQADVATFTSGAEQSDDITLLALRFNA